MIHRVSKIPDDFAERIERNACNIKHPELYRKSHKSDLSYYGLEKMQYLAWNECR